MSHDARSQLPAHVRTIQIDAAELDPEDAPARLRVHGVLEDRRPRGVPDWLQHEGDVIHRMEVMLTVRHPDLTITAVETRMSAFPHPGICPDALPAVQSLVGLRVDRGFTRAVNERLGRDKGCTHLTALILAMGPVVRQGAGAAFGFGRGRSPEGARERPWFINSCQAWREGGPLHTRWMEGWPGRER